MPSVLLDKIEFKLNENENNLNDHKLFKQQYHYLKPEQNGLSSSPNKLNGICNNKQQVNGNYDGLPSAKHTLCSSNAIQLEWKKVFFFSFFFSLN